uniref:Heat shock 70 kDa protein 12A-like isoform X2 n=1 Tax=Crassostrea virginica TaxID=6565 RepID=A0A8B8C7M4_CRAVI|nr:heat shock 70 kDa protein 12A-like isoform X2 [Crassostrea virginica]
MDRRMFGWNIKKDSNIHDVSGKALPAMTVFSLSIKYLKDHCLKTIADRGFLRSPNDVKFVLTVPAIWNDRSKQFMREAAVQAGIDNAQLTLALEPEAASIYCQRESLENMRVGRQSEITIPGTRYMVVDIGGGTADFSVHEVEEEGTLTELYRASGGPYGGIYVDKEYLKMYDTIFGKEAIDKLKKEDMGEYLTIIREFEAKKRTVTANYGSNFVTSMSAVLNEMVSNEEKKQNIQSSYLRDKVSLVKGKLKLSASLMESFFKDSLENIIDHVQNILKSVEDVNMILLVGGYGESPLVQGTFRNEFTNLEIIIPQDCNLAVMKGAVLFGHNPMSVTARILRFTYGVCVNSKFDPNIHPQERRFTDIDGVERCGSAFQKLIDRNVKVPSTGKIVTLTHPPPTESAKKYTLNVICTENDNPIVVDESCQFVGRLAVSVPEHFTGIWRGHEKYEFGMTEIKVSAIVKATNETFETTLDLLE